MYFVQQRELKEIHKVIDTGLWRYGEFLDREQIHHLAWKKKLAHIKKLVKDFNEEVSRF